jgi:hypothetical protein
MLSSETPVAVFHKARSLTRTAYKQKGGENPAFLLRLAAQCAAAGRWLL